VAALHIRLLGLTASWNVGLDIDIVWVDFLLLLHLGLLLVRGLFAARFETLLARHGRTLVQRACTLPPTPGTEFDSAQLS